MKHVRERPARRAGAPARGVGRRSPRRRPGDGQGPRRPLPRRADELIADLEEALAIETARAGARHRRGDDRAAHAARAAPGGALPLRVAHPGWLAWRRCSRVGVAAALVASVAADRTAARHRRAPAPSRRPGLAQVSLGQLARPGLRPRSATGGEHTRPGGFASSTATRRPPGRPRPTPAARWAARPASASTSTPRPGVAARVLEVRTPDAGLRRHDLRRADRRRPPTSEPGLGALAARTARRARHSASTLDTGGAALPLLPGLDHQARRRRGPRGDLRDRAVPVGRTSES